MSIKISFSLHTGRAYEGAIGSEYKVDAIFVSKEMQVALRLDDLCDVYNREILLTGELFMMLSDKAKVIARKIESVVMREQPKAPLVSPCNLYFFRKFTAAISLQVSLYQPIKQRTSQLRIHLVLSLGIKNLKAKRTNNLSQRTSTTCSTMITT